MTTALIASEAAGIDNFSTVIYCRRFPLVFHISPRQDRASGAILTRFIALSGCDCQQLQGRLFNILKGTVFGNKHNILY